ncbi:hypothetical protein B0H13DRAFT_1922014 [Mycena leptocephala]|nr:hypothetical protein B0H13DRAFT_1922014 [Mycena leptocephala]
MANVLGVFTTSLSRTTCCDPDDRQTNVSVLRLQLAKSDHLPCSRREFVCFINSSHSGSRLAEAAYEINLKLWIFGLGIISDILCQGPRRQAVNEARQSPPCMNSSRSSSRLAEAAYEINLKLWVHGDRPSMRLANHRPASTLVAAAQGSRRPHMTSILSFGFWWAEKFRGALHPRFPTSIPLALLFLRCSPPFVHEHGIRGPGLGLGRLFDRGAHDQYACGEFQRRGTIAPAQKDILSAILYLLPASDARTLVPLKGLYPWRRRHRSRSLRPVAPPTSQDLSGACLLHRPVFPAETHGEAAGIFSVAS